MHDHDHNHSSHDHAHGHGHAHAHSHVPADFGRAFLIGIGLNAGFVAIEALCGVLANSMALLADAGHNLSDVLGLAVAWLAHNLGKRAPSERFTYGLRGSSILAALFNAVLLLVTVGGLSWEAIQRLSSPEPVASGTMMAVAAIGIVVNAGTALLFASGRRSDLNIRGAYLHMAADAGVSLGVVLAALIIRFTGWLWLDPVASLLINAVIVWGAWGLLRDGTRMSLAAVPQHIDPLAVRDFLQSRPGVVALHDLHIWPMSTTEIALTAHIVVPDGHPGDLFLNQTAHELSERFGVHHATLQIETDPANACPIRPDSVV